MSHKKITDRLSFKVFVITFTVQILFGGLIYLLLYNAAPLSWDIAQKNEMETKFAKLSEELRQVEFKECGPLVDDFILTNNCNIVFYKGPRLNWNALPAVVPSSEYAVMTRYDVYNLINIKDGVVMNLYTSRNVNFNQEKSREYTVVCIWSQKAENVLWEALKKTLPLIIAAIILVSVICSFIYTHLFARPVQKLSEVSGRIAKMDFDVKSGSKRRDEIGDLGRDLDELSTNLNETITSLNKRTEELEREIERVNELERQKDVFFAAASHELKTPITIAQGQVRGMMDGIEPYNDIETYLPKTLSSEAYGIPYKRDPDSIQDAGGQRDRIPAGRSRLAVKKTS